MSEQNQPHAITRKPVLYEMPGMDAVRVCRDVEYRTTDAGALTMDIYYPPDTERAARVPAVIFVAGYPGDGVERMLGCKFKEMASSISWGRLTAASGLAAIVYTNREPEADLYALLQHVRQNAAALGIDETRIGIWACSGNVPLALAVLMRADDDLKCAVLCYGITLDLDAATDVAEAAGQWGFANPCAGKSVDDLPKHIPLFIVRAGQDEIPHLNETMDRFMAGALSCNLPVTLVNHPAAPHSFDLFYDSETTREIIQQILTFMRFHLLG
jgi:hypothetical protein